MSINIAPEHNPGENHYDFDTLKETAQGFLENVPVETVAQLTRSAGHNRSFPDIDCDQGLTYRTSSELSWMSGNKQVVPSLLNQAQVRIWSANGKEVVIEFPAIPDATIDLQYNSVSDLVFAGKLLRDPPDYQKMSREEGAVLDECARIVTIEANRQTVTGSRSRGVTSSLTTANAIDDVLKNDRAASVFLNRTRRVVTDSREDGLDLLITSNTITRFGIDAIKACLPKLEMVGRVSGQDIHYRLEQNGSTSFQYAGEKIYSGNALQASSQQLAHDALLQATAPLYLELFLASRSKLSPVISAEKASRRNIL
jgi:galactitol-specific phosphotransferase system IIB component